MSSTRQLGLLLAFISVSAPAYPLELKGAFPQKYLTAEAARLFQQNFQLFGDYVTRRTGVAIRIDPLPDMETLKGNLKGKKIDFCFGLTDLEALGLMESSLALPFLSVSPFRDLPQNGFRALVVAKKRGESSRWDLKTVVEEGEVTKGVNEIFAEILLQERKRFRIGKDPRRTDSAKIQVLEFGQSRDLILDVLSHPETAAVVDEEAYLLMKRRNPKLEEALQILEATGPVPITPLMVRSGLDPSVLERVCKSLLKMHEEAEGEEILRTLRVAKWVPVGLEDYEGLRDLVARAKKMGISLSRGVHAARH